MRGSIMACLSMRGGAMAGCVEEYGGDFSAEVSK
jgi:hypothetical protein